MIKLGLFFFLITFNSWAEFLPESFKADFKQSFVSYLSGKEKVSTGKIAYKYPSNIRLETLGPENLIYVGNKQKIWYYTAPFIRGEPGELIVKKAKEKNLSHFFDALKSGLKTNKKYSVKKISKNEYELNFLSVMQKFSGVKKATIKIGSKKRFQDIEKITITYTDNKKVNIFLTNFKLDFKFTEEYFSFVPPKNTKITN